MADRKSFSRLSLRAVTALGLAIGLTACGAEITPNSPNEFEPREQADRDRFGTVTGGGGAGGVFESLGDAQPGSFERQDEDSGGGGGGGIGVNAFLWQGSLETLDFLPLASADPFGGLIITDWYRPEETPSERVKVHVLITDRSLRADALSVSVFKQRAAGDGTWIDGAAEGSTARALEDQILTRARELRIKSTQAGG